MKMHLGHEMVRWTNESVLKKKGHPRSLLQEIKKGNLECLGQMVRRNLDFPDNNMMLGYEEEVVEGRLEFDGQTVSRS